MRLKKTEQKDFGASNAASCRSRSIWKFKNSNPNFLEASSTNNVYFGKCCREARLKWPEIKQALDRLKADKAQVPETSVELHI